MCLSKTSTVCILSSNVGDLISLKSVLKGKVVLMKAKETC